MSINILTDMISFPQDNPNLFIFSDLEEVRVVTEDRKIAFMIID